MLKRCGLFLGILLLLPTGCGEGGSSSGTRSGGELWWEFAIQSGVSTLDLDEPARFTAWKFYENGSSVPAAATWVISDPGIVSLDSTSGTGVTATGIYEGIATLTATFEDRMAQVLITVEWKIPDDPGPVFGCNDGEIVAYPPLGGGSPTLLYRSPAGTGRGFVVNRAGTAAYVNSWIGPWLFGLFRHDIANDRGDDKVSEFAQGGVFLGLDSDSNDRIVAQGWDNTRGVNFLQRFDPSTGELESLGSTGTGAWMLDLAVAPDDAVHLCPFDGSMPVMYRTVPGSGVSSPWALTPFGLAGGGPLAVGSCGLAINRRGEAFTGGVYSEDIYRYVDANGDGDAMDLGEALVWAKIPGSAAGVVHFGIAVTRGGGIMLNVQRAGMPTPTFPLGIYWLTDRDGSGFVDPAEIVLYNAECVNTGWDVGCIACRR